MISLHCRYGNFSVPDRNDLILNALREYGEWAQEELDMLAHFIRPGDTVIDAGSFVGTHARAFSQMVGAQGKVYAFEPNASTYPTLVSNSKLAPLANIYTYQMALGDKKRTMSVLEDGTESNLGASRLSEGDHDTDAPSVDVNRLDNFDFSRVDFIKADVEGMEYNLLVGGQETIQRHKPIFFLEANSLQATARIIDWAAGMNYVIFGHVSRAFNPDNFNRSITNMFGEARECGLLLIPRSKLGAWRRSTILPHLPIIDTLDGLALLLLHKPQYFSEAMERTWVAELHEIAFTTTVTPGRSARLASIHLTYE